MALFCSSHRFNFRFLEKCSALYCVPTFYSKQLPILQHKIFIVSQYLHCSGICVTIDVPIILYAFSLLQWNGFAVPLMVLLSIARLQCIRILLPSLIHSMSYCFSSGVLPIAVMHNACSPCMNSRLHVPEQLPPSSLHFDWQLLRAETMETASVWNISWLQRTLWIRQGSCCEREYFNVSGRAFEVHFDRACLSFKAVYSSSECIRWLL